METAVTGYDFFISYRWADGRAYATALARELKSRGFDVLLDCGAHRSDDEDGAYAVGDDLKLVGARAIQNTNQLILIGSPEVLNSRAQREIDYVLREVKIFSRSERNVIPIDFGGSLSPSAVKGHVLESFIPAHIIRLPETPEQSRQ